MLRSLSCDSLSSPGQRSPTDVFHGVGRDSGREQDIKRRRRRWRAVEGGRSEKPRPLIALGSLLAIGAMAVVVFSFNILELTYEVLGTVRDKSMPFEPWLAEANHRALRLEDEEASRSLNEEDSNIAGEIAVVHTFFSPIDPHTKLPTDKLNGTDKMMLDTWRAAWESQGWVTRVLTFDDAKRHPDFEAYDKALDSIPLGANAYYNRLCYLRWLAMAATPHGGYMSDYDVVPLFAPPKSHYLAGADEGKFAAYEGGVPSLLSGTKSEWKRMAQLLLSTAQDNHKKDPNQRLLSDMWILQELMYPREEHYTLLQEVLPGENAMDMRNFAPKDCRFLRSDGNRRVGGFKAVHFSHNAIHTAKGTSLREGESKSFSERSKIIRSWYKDWSKKCEGKIISLGGFVEDNSNTSGIMTPKEGFSWKKLHQIISTL